MHHSFKSTPTWTLKSRTQSITKSNQPISSPGPADYLVEKPHNKPQTIAQTKQIRNLYHKFQSVPGPGQYQSPSFITNGNKYSMRQTLPNSIKMSPSPHDYNNDTIVVKNKAPKFSMSTKSKSYNQLLHQKNSYKPSPQKYQPLKPFGKMEHKIFIGTSKRQPLDQNQVTPGPAVYSVDQADKKITFKKPQFKIGTQVRKNFVDNPQLSPGPAVYQKKSFIEQNQFKKKGFSCRPKTKDLIALQISKMPGPGQYQSHLLNKNTAPLYSTSHRPRQTFIDQKSKHQKQYPGPGHHTVPFASSKYRSVSCSHFSKSNRKNLYQNQVTPSPAVYQNQKNRTLRAAPKFSVGKQSVRHQDPNKKNIVPGPGQYDPSVFLVKDTQSVYKIPKQQRPNFEKEKYTPGPGYYNLRGKQQGPRWRFSSDKRLAFTDYKNQAKNGSLYQTSGSFPNPPKYMNSKPKITYNQKQ